MGRIKIKEFMKRDEFADELDSQNQNERVRTIQFGTRNGLYYIVYESIHEGSPHKVRCLKQTTKEES